MVIKFLHFLGGAGGIGLASSWAVGFQLKEPERNLKWLHQGIDEIKNNTQKSKGLILKIPLKELLNCSNNDIKNDCDKVREDMQKVSEAFKKGEEGDDTLGYSYNWGQNKLITNENCLTSNIKPTILSESGLWEMAELLLKWHCFNSYNNNQQNQFKKFLKIIKLDDTEKAQQGRLVGSIIGKNIKNDSKNWTEVTADSQANGKLPGWKEIVNAINLNLEKNKSIRITKQTPNEENGWSHIQVTY